MNDSDFQSSTSYVKAADVIVLKYFQCTFIYSFECSKRASQFATLS